MFSSDISTKAILVHRHSSGAIDVTTHDVTRIKGEFRLTAGQLMAESEQRLLGNVLLERNNNDEGYIDPRLLYRSSDKQVFYIPAAKVDVSYSLSPDCSPDDVHQFQTVLPTLVVKNEKNTIKVIAVSGKHRPDLQATVYYPPLGNVYSNCSICEGSYKGVNTRCVNTLIESLTGFVLGATNTHSGNITPIKGLPECGREEKFKQQMLFLKKIGESGKSFPIKKLEVVPHLKNLREFINDE